MIRPTYMLIALLALASTILSGIIYIPSQTPGSPWNTGENGVSGITEVVNASIRDGLSGLQCGGLILISASRSITSEEAELLKNLIECGSIVLVADGEGYSRELLGILGIDVKFKGFQVLDEASSAGYRWIIKSRVTLPNGSSFEVAIPNATYMLVSTPPNYLVAHTSNYAYADTDGNGFYDTYDQMGVFTVMAGWRIGNGALILVPSSLFLFNAYVSILGNTGFLVELSKGRETVLYVDPYSLTWFDRLKYSFYLLYAGRPMVFTYYLTLITASTTVALWLYSKGGGRPGKREALLLSVSIASPIYGFYMSREPIYLTALLLYPVLYLLTPAAYSALSISLSLAGVVLNPVFTLLYIFSSLIVARSARREPGYWILGYASIFMLGMNSVNTLTVLLNPPTSLCITTSMVFTLLLSILIYIMKLRGVTVAPLSTRMEVYAGSNVELGFNVSTSSPVVCVVELDSGIRYELVENEETVSVRRPVEHIGLNRFTLRIGLMDPSGYSWRDIGLLSYEVNVLPLTSKMLEKAGLLLKGSDIGRLLQYVSITVLMRIEETGRLIRLDEERLAEIARRGAVKEGASSIIMEVVREYMSSLGEGVAGTRIGDYRGVRLYEPGDSLRDIHWKKTLGILELVAKTYEASGEHPVSEGGAGGGVLVIANLNSTSPLELDALLAAVLHHILDNASVNPEFQLEMMLIAGRYILVLKGPAMGVLGLFYNVLREKPIESMYNYNSYNRYPEPVEVEYMISSGPEVFKVLATVFEIDGRELVASLLREDIKPGRQFTLIHGRATSTWASFMAYYLTLAGYIYAGQREVGLI
ncbi:MAG: DUF58 domain-containing protein [Desulfurococcus sp.]|uniref:DUF58 domain-containing protein n=3 Tax=Desulfurococcus sp. TaxID=51678 RepID=UPI00316130D7